MTLASALGKKSDKGDLSELPDQVKGTFGDGDIINRAESLKGLLQNGAGMLGRAPGALGVIGKGISGGMSMLDKGSDLVKDLTGTSGYEWLGTGAAKATERLWGEPVARSTGGYDKPPEGMKRIFVDNQPRFVPVGQQGPGPKPAAPTSVAPEAAAPEAAAPEAAAPAEDASERREPLGSLR